MSIEIFTSRLVGKCVVPPSKSQTIRALAFAGLSSGKSQITNFLHSPDTTSMIEGLRQFGVKIEKEENLLTIYGVAGEPSLPKDPIDVGNSGLAYRFLSAYAALTDGETIITGDRSIREKRVITPLLSAFRSLGALSYSTHGGAPIYIKGRAKEGSSTVDGKDSQVISSLFLLMSFLPGLSSLHVTNPGELPFIDMTLSWLKIRKIAFYRESYTFFALQGKSLQQGFSYTVPSDFSSLAFLLVAALITNSTLQIEKMDFSDSQGDKWLIACLQRMGAKIEIRKDHIVVYPSGKLEGGVIDVQPFIDAVPILSVLGCFTKKGIIIQNASICRKKESDRLSVMKKELSKMQAKIEEREDGLTIFPSSLSGNSLFSHNDHRVAMSLTVAALNAKGKTIIEGYQCAEKSFPGFFHLLKSLGGRIENLS